MFAPKYINRVTLLGVVIAEPSLRGSTNNPVLMFRFETKSGSQQQYSQRHRISVFDQTLIDYLLDNEVGAETRLYLEGHINYGSFRNALGNTVNTANIVPSTIVILDGR